MRKIYSFAFAAVAVLSAASCQEQLETLEPKDTATEGVPFSFNAELSADTKTVLIDGVKTYWTTGDQVAAFDNSGAAVTFSTPIDANSASALFTTENFAIPSDYTIHAIYPSPAKAGSAKYTLEDGLIKGLRLSATQTAVAGGFDPSCTMAYACGTITSTTTPPTLEFKHLHSLVKFTIGGDEVPETITLTNNGSASIAGQLIYNTSSGEFSLGENHLKTVTLKPAEGESFEIGKTYYIAFRANCNLVDMTLAFDGTAVKVHSGTFYNVSNGKIFDMGEVSFPEVIEEPVVSAINVTRVWGKYGVADGNVAWSNSIISDLDNNDRSLAMDDEYIYIPQTTGSVANIHKFKISDGSYVGTLPTNDDMNLGTHYVSCARTVQNADGDYILLVCNLSLGQDLRIFAYVNGTDQAPVTMTTISGNSRRWGDKFTVTGTWENGKMWFRSYDDRGMVGYLPLNGTNSTWTGLEAHAIDNGTALDASNISEVTWAPGTTGYCLINTNSTTGAHIMSGTEGTKYTEVKTYSSLAKTFGYNFFEVGENKFVAWVSLAKGSAKPRLQIVQSDATTLEGMQATFDNLSTRLVYEAPIQNEDAIDNDGAYGTHTVCDCCVREINGEIYIAALAQKSGLSVFKVTAK